jgi:hypothetical protein
MNQTPSVAMNDGTLRVTWTTPLKKPTPAPRRRTPGMASIPKSLALAPLSTSIDRMTAASVNTPSTDRSIDPMSTMNVSPRPSTSGIMAAWLTRTRLPKVKKLGLTSAMKAQSAARTASGAHAAYRRLDGAPRRWVELPSVVEAALKCRSR